MSKNVVIVGGGLAGLAASIYLARAGRTVTVFEKRRYLGGRAITQLRHGYRFNLGAHAFYRAGAAASVCKELGVPVPGVLAKPKAIALIGGEVRPSFVDALKVARFGAVPFLLAGIFLVLPVVVMLMIVAGIHSHFLFNAGLHSVM